MLCRGRGGGGTNHNFIHSAPQASLANMENHFSCRAVASSEGKEKFVPASNWDDFCQGLGQFPWRADDLLLPLFQLLDVSWAAPVAFRFRLSQLWKVDSCTLAEIPSPDETSFLPKGEFRAKDVCQKDTSEASLCPFSGKERTSFDGKGKTFGSTWGGFFWG